MDSRSSTACRCCCPAGTPHCLQLALSPLAAARLCLPSAPTHLLPCHFPGLTPPCHNRRKGGTFRSVKNVPVGAKGLTLKQHIEHTLGTGAVEDAVRLPPGEDMNEWLAVNTGGHLPVGESSTKFAICTWGERMLSLGEDMNEWLAVNTGGGRQAAVRMSRATLECNCLVEMKDIKRLACKGRIEEAASQQVVRRQH